MSERERRWWPVAVLAGLMLAVAVLAASASIDPASMSPAEWQPLRWQLSGTEMWAAYPDIDVGDAGLVAVVWTEGDGSASEKHRGPLKLGWISNDSPEWTVQTVTSDPSDVIDAAVAVLGTTVHLVWSQGGAFIYYTTCVPPDYACDPARVKIAQVTNPEAATASQVDIALDSVGGRHVVWVQDNEEQVGNIREVRYRYQGSVGGWGATLMLNGSLFSERPAVACADGFVHIAWTELDDESTLIKYCRRAVGGASWTDCEELANWSNVGIGDYLARNLSLTAEGSNVYAAWDLVKAGQTNYAIGYVHSGNVGLDWQPPRTFPRGPKSGGAGTAFFESVEAAEYVRYLRPYITVAPSGTVKVPVLAWHAKLTPDVAPESTSTSLQGTAYKAFWTYALQPGSDNQGNLFWATEHITLSTNLGGEVDISVNSAGASLGIEGDLKAVLDSEWQGEGRLHATYHEAGTKDKWRVFYNSNEPVNFSSAIYLPLVLHNASGGSEG